MNALEIQNELSELLKLLTDSDRLADIRKAVTCGKTFYALIAKNPSDSNQHTIVEMMNLGTNSALPLISDDLDMIKKVHKLLDGSPIDGLSDDRTIEKYTNCDVVTDFENPSKNDKAIYAVLAKEIDGTDVRMPVGFNPDEKKHLPAVTARFPEYQSMCDVIQKSGNFLDKYELIYVEFNNPVEVALEGA